MIIVKLMGGLGNQMFQYAAGRRLAGRYGTKLKFDGSFLYRNYSGCTPRQLELQHLNLELHLATPLEVAEVVGKGPNLFVTGLVRIKQFCGIGGRRGTVYCESVYHYDSMYEVMSDHAYLEGYWQSPQYFVGIEQLLREEFQVTTPLDEKNIEMLEQIRSCNAVSVHVRRGDYITNPNAAQHHGVCGINYYREAVTHMDSLVQRPVYFVFSDDPDWTREHLGFIQGAEYVVCNGSDRGTEDFRLLSNCRHHIIANSSFSWWGAWLGADTDKKVIAPARWYLHNNIGTTNLFPASWIRL